MTICNLTAFLQIFGPMLGLFAGAAWTMSAWYGRFYVTDEAIDTTMMKQSRWNAYAAIFASLSAFAQVSTSFVPVCRALS
jgi:hypothetical protein